MKKLWKAAVIACMGGLLTAGATTTIAMAQAPAPFGTAGIHHTGAFCENHFGYGEGFRWDNRIHPAYDVQPEQTEAAPDVEGFEKMVQQSNVPVQTETGFVCPNNNQTCINYGYETCYSNASGGAGYSGRGYHHNGGGHHRGGHHR